MHFRFVEVVNLNQLSFNDDDDDVDDDSFQTKAIGLVWNVIEAIGIIAAVRTLLIEIVNND